MRNRLLVLLMLVTVVFGGCRTPAREPTGPPVDPNPLVTDSTTAPGQPTTTSANSFAVPAESGDMVPGDRPTTAQIHGQPGGGACVTGRSPGWYEPLLVFAPAPVFNSLPDCPGPKRPPPTPRDAAFQSWYWQTKLPKPSLGTSPPDAATTGLDLYLAIGGEQTIVRDTKALGYDVHPRITSVYDVDWGDPRPDTTNLGQAVTRNHPTQGGPWPTGDLRHQYIERGNVTMKVTQRWTAHWSAGGESGTIAHRLLTSATRTVPVQEIQAVLTNSSSP